MSRIAKEPVELPKGVEFKQDGDIVTWNKVEGGIAMKLTGDSEHWVYFAPVE